VLHASERGKGGHVHLLELDQFIGPNYLVTVHGPVNPAAPADAALRETRAVLKRIQAGRLHPRSSFELSYAVVSAVTRHQEAFVATLAREAGLLEQQVMSGEIGDPSSSSRSCSVPAMSCWWCGPWPGRAARSAGGWLPP
jgi:hypothetical protein